MKLIKYGALINLLGGLLALIFFSQVNYEYFICGVVMASGLIIFIYESENKKNERRLKWQ